MVSLPTRGTSRLLMASSATRRTVHRGETFGRVAADHGDDPLFLAVFQQSVSSRPLFLVERPFQSAFLIAMADLPDRLRCQRHHTGNPRCTDPLGQLQKGDCPQNNPDLLNTAAQQFL